MEAAASLVINQQQQPRQQRGSHVWWVHRLEAGRQGAEAAGATGVGPCGCRAGPPCAIRHPEHGGAARQALDARSKAHLRPQPGVRVGRVRRPEGVVQRDRVPMRQSALRRNAQNACRAPPLETVPHQAGHGTSQASEQRAMFTQNARLAPERALLLLPPCHASGRPCSGGAAHTLVC